MFPKLNAQQPDDIEKEYLTPLISCRHEYQYFQIHGPTIETEENGKIKYKKATGNTSSMEGQWPEDPSTRDTILRYIQAYTELCARTDIQR